MDHMRLDINLPSYLVLLQVGFTMPFMLPSTRCALTTPFHPYLLYNRRYIFCCTFHELSPSRRYLALCPVEPGLSSADFSAAITSTNSHLDSNTSHSKPIALLPSLSNSIHPRLRKAYFLASRLISRQAGLHLCDSLILTPC